MLLHLQSHVGQRRKRSPVPCLRENLKQMHREPGSSVSTCSSRCMQKYLSPQAWRAEETTIHIEEPEARRFPPSPCSNQSWPVAQGVSAFGSPCAHLGPTFLTSSGPLEPVPLPSELGWVLLLAEIRDRGRAIFCHGQEVRTQRQVSRRLAHDCGSTRLPTLCPRGPSSPACSQRCGRSLQAADSTVKTGRGCPPLSLCSPTLPLSRLGSSTPITNSHLSAFSTGPKSRSLCPRLPLG